MTNLTERVAKAIYAAIESDPLADELALAVTEEIFNYLENPSEDAQEAGEDAMRDSLEWAKPEHCWKAMLAQFKEEALGER
jgi:hypothetical protein